MYEDPVRGPNEVVILFDTERGLDLDDCVRLAEQALGLDTVGVITSDEGIGLPDVGASVYLVERDGETLFYFCAPEQVPVVVRAGKGCFPGTEEVAEQRSWVHLTLETRAYPEILPGACMLLQRLTAGFMENGALQLYVPALATPPPQESGSRDSRPSA